MDPELERAVLALRDAIKNEGPVPQFHRDLMQRHRREWPTLWHAIDALMEKIV